MAPDAATGRLGIVIPLANEEETVDELVRRVTAQLEPEDGVLFVVDNASRDATRERVAQAERRDPRVVLVWAPKNRCVVDAYFAGYRAALAAGYDWILEMDGGFSHLPEEIPRFRAAMARGIDFAGGCRFMPGASMETTMLRWLLSRGGTWLANQVLGTRMRDMTSGFECFTAPTLQAVVARGVESRGHFFQTEIRFQMHDFDWLEVPISYSTPSPRVGSANVLEAFRNLARLRRRYGCATRSCSGALSDG